MAGEPFVAQFVEHFYVERVVCGSGDGAGDSPTTPHPGFSTTANSDGGSSNNGSSSESNSNSSSGGGGCTTHLELCKWRHHLALGAGSFICVPYGSLSHMAR